MLRLNGPGARAGWGGSAVLEEDCRHHRACSLYVGHHARHVMFLNTHACTCNKRRESGWLRGLEGTITQDKKYVRAAQQVWI